MKSVLLVLFASAAFGQFTSLATTDDGAQLYFSSPQWLKNGGDVNFNPKIMRNVGDFETFREAAFVPQVTPYRTGYFRLTDPQVSGDGTIVAWTANAACIGGIDCQNAQPQTESHIAGAVLPNKPDYSGIRLSGDGRRALLAYEPGALSFVDLATGTATSLFPYVEAGDGRQAFADSGSILRVDNSGNLLLWDSGSTTMLGNTRTAGEARLSRNGTTVVYQAPGPKSLSLIALDVNSGAETVLTSAFAGRLQTMHRPSRSTGARSFTSLRIRTVSARRSLSSRAGRRPANSPASRKV